MSIKLFKLPRLLSRPSHSTVALAGVSALFAFSSSAVEPAAFGQVQGTAAPMEEHSIGSIQAVPRLVKFSGVLLDSRGYPVTVPVDVTFALYPLPGAEGSNPSGAIWKEKQHVSPNEKGAYTVYLGALQVLPAEVFTSVAAHFIGVQVEAEPELARTVLASVPYALESGDAQTLGGLPASAFVRAGSTNAGIDRAIPQAGLVSNAAAAVTTTGGTTNFLPKFSGATTVISSQIFDNGSSIGLGTNAPNSAVKLDVNGSLQVRGKFWLPASGLATTSVSYKSSPLQFFSSAWNSSTKKVDTPYFTLQSEPSGNNTASAAANLNLLFSNNGATSAETGLYFQPNGAIHFAPAQTFPYHGTVSSIGLSAPSSDFTVSGSPVTGAGQISLLWNTAPTSYNVGSGIVKRDSSGGFAAGAINANSLAATGSISSNSLTVYGNSYLGAANLSGPIGIGTNSPAVLLNLNKNNAANADALLIGNTSSKGLQLRDNGAGVDIESIGVPLNINYLTKRETVINPNGGTVSVNDNRDYSGPDFYALQVGTIVDNIGLQNSAFFDGQVEITGRLLVDGEKNFRIDDPLDPANKYLVHASIESSEVLNQYSGNITTDELGLATVHLPEWFGVENVDFRYQLTVIGGRFAQAIVSKEIERNQFTISTNASNVKVSWQVTARRNDPYIKAHPMVVEEEKPAGRRGTYNHPELYGQPESKRTGGAHRSVSATPMRGSIATAKP